jgi:hypothetical protein
MAQWKEYKIKDIVQAIDDGSFVLPVIQRRLVWDEEKMTLLFDSLLKRNAFGGVMVLEQVPGRPPLFALRNFLKDFTAVHSLSTSRNQTSILDRTTYFVIDGQQRMQTFYIGLKGSYEGKILFFNLYSNGEEEFEFAFSDNEDKLPKREKDDDGNEKENFWYSVPALYQKFIYDSLVPSGALRDICVSHNIVDTLKSQIILQNLESFYLSVCQEECLGISIVVQDGRLDEVGNRQKMVELFQRLNNGGTVLSPYDLMASTLRGLDWRMEAFLDRAVDFGAIGITQNELIKLIFILQDTPAKNLANIEPKDTEFALGNEERIFNTLVALHKFLVSAKLENYYLNARRSAVPLYLAAYHIYHRKSIPTNQIPTYFDNDVTGNPDFSNLKRWFYLSLLNGVFKGKKAGWVSEKTGLNKVYNLLKKFKDRKFPVTEIFTHVYREHRLRFWEDVSPSHLNAWDMDFLFYVMYDFEKHNSRSDIDHIHPKSLLEGNKVSPEKINCVENFQLIDFSTNRGDKNNKTLEQWVNNPDYVPNKDEYIKRHLIPPQEFWAMDKYLTFIEKRAEMIIEKIKPSIPSAEKVEEVIEPIPNKTPHEKKIEIAQKHGVANEFVALHKVTGEIRLWPTYLVDAIQYHHNVSGTKVLLTVYIRDGGFGMKFYTEKFPDYYTISKDEMTELFGKWQGEFWLNVKQMPDFIARLEKLKSFLK